MANETGGELLKNANDLGPAFDTLLERTGLIYILAFQPVRVPETGKFHTLKVRARDKSWHVSHRTGYYEAKSYTVMSPMEKKLVASSAIAAAVPKTDIPAWILATPFPTGRPTERVPSSRDPGRPSAREPHGAEPEPEPFIYAIDSKGVHATPLPHDRAESRESARAAPQGGVKFYGEMSLRQVSTPARADAATRERGATA